MTKSDNSDGNFESTEIKTKANLTREALYELVWSEPMLKVAARLGVSSSYMARVCAHMNVPRPERGYWAKLAAGQQQKHAPLPEAKLDDLLVWSKGGGGIQAQVPLPRPPVRAKRSIKIPVIQTNLHPLISGSKELFASGGLSHECGYLKPNKRLLVDFIVTQKGLDKVLSFANRLFMALEECGYRVVIAKNNTHLHREKVDERENPYKSNHYNNLWSPFRITVVYVGTVAIGLTFIEMSEEVKVRYVKGEYVRESEYVTTKRGGNAFDHTWTTMKDFPTGRICLQAYSPYPRTNWKKQWKESNSTSDIGNQIKKIVKELEDAAVEIARLAEEGIRQAEIDHQKREEQFLEWRRQEAERRHSNAIKESKEELHRIIDRWDLSNKIEQFFLDVERRAEKLDESARVKLFQKLKEARQLIGNIDALEHFLHWKSPEDR